MASNELFHWYLDIIYGGDVDVLRAFYREHPLPPDFFLESICDAPECGCVSHETISSAITTDLKKVTVEMHRTVLDLGLITKTNMEHLGRAIRFMYEETEFHVDMLIRTMDATAIRDFRTEEDETVIGLICTAYLNPTSTRAPALIKYLIETIGVDPSCDYPSIMYHAIRHGWLDLVKFLHEHQGIPLETKFVGDDRKPTRFPTVSLIEGYLYWKQHDLIHYHEGCLSKFVEVLDYLRDQGMSFAEYAPGLSDLITAHHLPIDLGDASLPHTPCTMEMCAGDASFPHTACL